MELVLLLRHELSEGAEFLLGVSQAPLHTGQGGLLDRQRHLEAGQRCEYFGKARVDPEM